MVHEAGMEIIFIILWVLFSIWGTIQKKKKDQAKKEAPSRRPARPVTDSSEEEDPFKKMMEEILGRQETREVVREVKPPLVVTAEPPKKSTYQGIPTAPESIENPYGFSGSIEAPYTLASFSTIPTEEGLPQTFRKEDMQDVATKPAKTPASLRGGLLVNGHRMSMREAVTAQLILEKKF